MFTDGQPYQGIDHRNGALNETAAPLNYEPLVCTAPNATAAPWQQFRPWTCY